MTAKVGILGLGYLGQSLWREFPEDIAWGTFHRESVGPPDSSPPSCFLFQWENPRSWHHLPEAPVTLVLTIPPVLKDPQSERERIEQWGKWMNRERPRLEKLIYISSTGIYPLADGLWKESDSFEPDRLGGKLRLETEKVLENFFKVGVVRPGGIYGPRRNVGQRVLNQQPITKNQRPIHRIHVKDLAGIVQHLALTKTPPFCLNAVDHEPQPSSTLLEWLLENQYLVLPSECKIQFRENASTSANQRLISNHQLLVEMQYALQYPSFREGLAEIFSNPPQEGGSAQRITI